MHEDEMIYGSMMTIFSFTNVFKLMTKILMRVTASGMENTDQKAPGVR
jgi:hypothetical protein